MAKTTTTKTRLDRAQTRRLDEFIFFFSSQKRRMRRSKQTLQLRPGARLLVLLRDSKTKVARVLSKFVTADRNGNSTTATPRQGGVVSSFKHCKFPPKALRRPFYTPGLALQRILAPTPLESQPPTPTRQNMEMIHEKGGAAIIVMTNIHTHVTRGKEKGGWGVDKRAARAFFRRGR